MEVLDEQCAVLSKLLEDEGLLQHLWEGLLATFVAMEAQTLRLGVRATFERT